MHDAAFVRVRERASHRSADPSDPLRVRGALAPGDVAQCPPGDELHHDERASLVLADVVDRHDADVGEARGGARFPPEPSEESIVGSELRSEHLDRDGPPEASIDGLEDLAHATSSEQGPHLVAIREQGAERGRFGHGGRHAAQMVTRRPWGVQRRHRISTPPRGRMSTQMSREGLVWSRKTKALAAGLLVAAMMAAGILASAPANAATTFTVNSTARRP